MKTKPEDILTIIVGVILIVCLILFGFPKKKAKSFTPAPNVITTDNYNNGWNVGGQDEHRYTLEELGITSDNSADLNLLMEADDDPEEFWEIEQLDGKYYRVRREDYDREYYDEDDYECEELIGDKKDLMKYAGER